MDYKNKLFFNDTRSLNFYNNDYNSYVSIIHRETRSILVRFFKRFICMTELKHIIQGVFNNNNKIHLEKSLAFELFL